MGEYDRTALEYIKHMERVIERAKNTLSTRAYIQQ